MMDREDYEIAVMTEMWSKHGIMRTTASDYLQKQHQTVSMCFMKGRPIKAVAKALAEQLIAAARA